MNADNETIVSSPSEATIESVGTQETAQVEHTDNPANPPSEDLPPHKYIERRNDQSESKRGGYQKRINKITADKHMLRSENEELRSRLDLIERRLPPIERTDSADSENETQSEVEQSEGHQNDVREPTTDYSRQESEREQKARASYIERIEKVAERRPDLSQKAAAIQINTKLLRVIEPAIVELENGQDVTVHLIDHPDVVQKLHTMSPAGAVAYLGRISAQLESTTTTERARSRASAPITPVDTGSSRSSVPLEDLSPSEYQKIRNAQREKRRGW